VVITETTGYIVGAGSTPGWAAFDVYDLPYAEGNYTSITYLNDGEQFEYSINDEEVTLDGLNNFLENMVWEDYKPQVTVEQSQVDGVNIININVSEFRPV
jgi:hypothetical protein